MPKVVVLLFVLMVSSCFAREVVKIRVVNNVVLVPVRVNGKDLTFLLDTGSEHSAIDANVASSLSLGQVADVEVHPKKPITTKDTKYHEGFNPGLSFEDLRVLCGCFSKLTHDPRVWTPDSTIDGVVRAGFPAPPAHPPGSMTAEQVSAQLHGEEGTAVNLILERGDDASAVTLHTRQMLCGHNKDQHEYRSQR